MIRHIVEEGECLSSIAFQYRLTWSRLWNLPENKPLRELRQNPNILFAGDIVFVPVNELGSSTAPTDQAKAFVLSVDQPRLRVRVLLSDQPLANEPYQASVDNGEWMNGTTDGDGMVDQPISAGAESALIWFTNLNKGLPVQFGFVDPIDTLSGVQSRLLQLGFYKGQVDGIAGPLTQAAVCGFQRSITQDETGDPDDIRDALSQAYGS